MVLQWSLLIKFSNQLRMHYETLYQQSKWKRHQQERTLLEQQQYIKQMSSSKKINPLSHTILANKLTEQLSLFEDETPINIETSIPILHRAGVLTVIQDIESAKQRLQRGQFQNSRLREQARFVYCLWKMIDEQEIETRELKEVIYLLNERRMGELRGALGQIYQDQEAVLELVETWRVLMRDSQYYKGVEQQQKKGARGEIERVLETFTSGTSGNFSEECREISEQFSKPARLEGPTADSYLSGAGGSRGGVRFASRGKENMSVSGLVGRLYRNDRYQAREAQRQVEEERKLREEMAACTFKPELCGDRLRSVSRNKRGQSINGFEKSVNRMKVGVERNRMEKERREHKPAGQNYYKLREKNIKPPKFLQRKKEEEAVQFVIEFDLGRHKVKVRVRETDREEDIAKNLCKIYCLKQDYFQQICLIIRSEREAFAAEQPI